MLCLFAVRSFSLGQTATRTSALAVIRMPRRTRVKASTCKAKEVEPEEECSKMERWKRLNLYLSQTTDYSPQQTTKKYYIFNISITNNVTEVGFHTIKSHFYFIEFNHIWLSTKRALGRVQISTRPAWGHVGLQSKLCVQCVMKTVCRFQNTKESINSNMTIMYTAPRGNKIPVCSSCWLFASL